MLSNLPCRAAFILLGLVYSNAFASPVSPKAVALDGSEVDLFGVEAKAVVAVVFVAVECPISNRFAPEVNRIYEEFGDGDFQMWTVYTDDTFSKQEIESHRKDYQYLMPALLDFDRTLARYCGANVTPEAVVFVREGAGQYRMVYRGRVNNQYVEFGKWRPKPTRHDLRELIELLASGTETEIAFRSNEAIGCYIGE